MSWGWESEQPGPSTLVDYHEWQGTRDIAPFLAVPAAVRFMDQHDWPQVRHRCHGLVRHARGAITDLTGLPPITPDAPDWFSQMAAFPLPPCDAEALQRRLYGEFRVEIPIISWHAITL